MTCEQLSEALGFRYVNVGECVASQSLHAGWDPKFEAHIIDEDKVSHVGHKVIQREGETSGRCLFSQVSKSLLFSHRCVMPWRISLQREEQLWIITAATSSLKGQSQSFH